MTMTYRTKWRCAAGLALVGWLALLALPLAAQQEEDFRPKRLKDYDLPGLEAKVNLTSLDAWDVVQLIEFLAYKGGLKNIVIGKGVSGLTTKLKFDNVTVGDALEVVLSVNNLAYVVKGGIITIMTDTEYTALHGTSFYDQKKVRVVELKYADPARVATMLGVMKSAIGTVVSDPVTGTLILIDTPAKIAEMMTVVEKADINTVSRVLPTETRTYVLEYAEVDDVQTAVEAVLTQDIGSLNVDERTKSLVVTDLPHSLAKVEQLIDVFDAKPPQVFIEAKIVAVTLTDAFSLGVDWEYVLDGLDPRFSLNAASPFAMPGTSDGMKLTYKTIAGDGDLGMVLEALQSVGETKVLASPHIAVTDGEEAVFKVVTEQPYVELKYEGGDPDDDDNITGRTYKFVEVGVMLQVTPRINAQGFISMDIRPEVSDIDGFYDEGEDRGGTPIVTKSYAETTVTVKDGVTIIIAGMIEERKSETENRVPLLGQIPLLGMLFRNESVEKSNTERIVFLTPRVVSGDEPYLRMRDMKKKPKPLRPVGKARDKELKPLR